MTKSTDGNGESLGNAPDASGKALGVFMDIDDYDDAFVTNVGHTVYVCSKDGFFYSLVGRHPVARP